MDTADKVLSRAQIERDLILSNRFIQTASSDSAIREKLSAHGYTEEVHNEGASFYMHLFAEKRPWFFSRGGEPSTSKLAVKALNEWDRKHYLMTRSTLDHLFPDQAAYLFDGLPMVNNFGAAASIKTFLSRIVSFREGTDPDREAFRDEDRAAVLALEGRNIVGPEIEARLQRLIEEATRLAPLPVKDEAAIAVYHETARKHHAWLADWRGMARAVITNRNQLIQLGLSRRRIGKARIRPLTASPGGGSDSGCVPGEAPSSSVVPPSSAGATLPCCGNTPGSGSAGPEGTTA